MPEDDDRDEASGHGVRRQVNWEAIAAIIAALVGLLAIVIAAYTAWSTHQQTSAQVWPYLGIATSNTLPPAFATTVGASGIVLGHGGRIMVQNKGVGPAIVRRVEVEVNGKPEPDWHHVLAAIGLHDMVYHQSRISHTVVAPGDTVNVLMMPDKEAWASFKAKGSNVHMRICYCSTLGECWIKQSDSVQNHPQGQPVGFCAAIPKADEFKQ